VNSDLRNGLLAEGNYARVLQNLLWASIVFSSVLVVLGLFLRSPDGTTPLTTTVGVLVSVATGLYLVTGVYWLLWTYRVYDNLRVVGSRETTMTPGWAVGWWFIPIANLWMPYRVMREINARSEISNEYELLNGSPIGIVEWWALFWLSVFSANLSVDSENLALELLSFVLQVAFYFYSIKVVRGIGVLQQKMLDPVPVSVNPA
jgi:hypothetical protein